MSRTEIASDLLFVIAAGLAIAACALWSIIAALVAGSVVAFIAGAILWQSTQPAKTTPNTNTPFSPGG